MKGYFDDCSSCGGKLGHWLVNTSVRVCTACGLHHEAEYYSELDEFGEPLYEVMRLKRAFFPSKLDDYLSEGG